MSDLVGRTLGQYEIIAELGHGGMANVYRATQASIGREVAIKVLPAHFMQDRTFIERFIREVKVIARLQHPRILPVIDYGEADGMPYIVMALLPGGTLSDRIKQSGALPLDDAAKLLNQIAEGLEYAHEQGVVHRDFKPSNVLLDSKGNAYLADFGIAKVTADTAQLTGSGMIGTPAYMAPEMSRPGGLSPLIDVYALGVTLYQMITGQQPYQADTPIGVMMAHATEPIPDARLLRPGLPDSVQAVLEMALAKNPAERFATPIDLAQAFSAAAAGAPYEADDGTTMHMMGSAHGMTTPQMPLRQTSPTPIVPPGSMELPAIKESPKVVAPVRIGKIPRSTIVIVGGVIAAILLVLCAITWLIPQLQASGIIPEQLGTGDTGGDTDGGESSGDLIYNFSYYLEEHEDAITGLAFSPDGEYLATGSQDSTIKVWQASNGENISQIGADSAVEDLDFSADSSVLASAQFQHGARWDPENGETLDNIGWTGGSIWAVALSPDGEHAITGGEDADVVFWTLDGSRDPFQNDAGGQVRSVDYAPDSSSFAAVDELGKLALYNNDDASVLRIIDVGKSLFDVVYSPDSSLIATLSGDAIQIWDVETGGEHLRLSSVPSGMRAIDWSSGPNLIAGGGESNAVIVWNADTGLPVQTMFQHEETITDIAFSSDGNLLASGDESGKVIVWQLVGELPSGGVSGDTLEVTLIQPLGSATNGMMRHVAISPDGSRIVTGAESAVIVWDAEALVDNYVFDIGTPPRAPDVTFTPDSSIVLATVDTDIRAWNVSDGSSAESLVGHSGLPVAVAIAPNGEKAASGGEDGKLILWNTADRTQINTVAFIPESITSIGFSLDSSLIAVGLSSGTVNILSSNNLEFGATLSGHSGAVQGLATSPDGSLLASASDDGTIKLWNMNGSEAGTLSSDDTPIYTVAFSPDGTLIAGGNEGGHLIFWDTAGNLLADVHASDSPIYDMDFALGGSILVAAQGDGYATVWDVSYVEQQEAPTITLPEGATGQIVFTTNRDGEGNQEIYMLNLDDMSQTNLTNSPGRDFSPAYSPDSASIAFVSDRNGEQYEDYIYLMDPDGGNQRRILEERALTRPAWSPDSQWLAFSRYSDDSASLDVFKAMIDGTGMTQVTTTPRNDFVSDWTNDGVHIVFTNDADSGDTINIVCECGGDSLFTLKSDNPDNRDAVYSPDGSKFAFTSNWEGEWFIYIMNADLTGLYRLAEGFNPSWSPFGGYIVFSSYRDGNDELYLIAIDGTRETRLTYNEGDDHDPDWRP